MNILENEYVKSLGNLDEDGKKIIWNTCISGSQVKKLFYNMREVYTEKKTIQTEKIFSEKATQKMAMGKALEPVIRNLASEKWNLDIKYSPDTYALTANPFFTANIDGYREIPNGIEIIEIKNTEEKDIEKLYDFYKYQIQYYMFFFQAKSARLIALSNGWNLQQLEIEPDEELQKQIVDRCNALAKAIQEGVLDPEYFNEAPKEDAAEIHISYLQGTEFGEKLNKLNELKQSEDAIKEEIESLENDIKNTFAEENKKVVLATETCNYTLTVTERKGTVDYKALLKDYDIANDVVEKYRKDSTKVIKGVLTELI